MPEMTLEEISKKLREIDFAILFTHTEGGALAGRPMSNNCEVDYDGDAFFFTRGEARTVADISRDPRVGLAYQGKPGLIGARPPFFLMVEGRAELIRDRARFEEHWTEGLDAWFKQGVDTPGLVLIKVVAERIHYWDGYEEAELKRTPRAAVAEAST